LLTILASLGAPALADRPETKTASVPPTDDPVTPVVETLLVEQSRLPAVAVAWARFRDYVTAHAWIADIDFREGQVQGMHLCAGFNGFREPDQLRALGVSESTDPDPYLQQAAFVIAMNAESFLQTAFAHVRDVVGTDGYAESEGADRLAFARAELWKRVSADAAIDVSLKRSMAHLIDVTQSLVVAGLLSADSLPENPVDYMNGMNTILGGHEASAGVLADSAFAALSDRQARIEFYKNELVDHLIGEAEIEDAQQVEQYRSNLLESLDQMFGAGGCYVIKIKT
jgi:hypothetical protein